MPLITGSAADRDLPAGRARSIARPFPSSSGSRATFMAIRRASSAAIPKRMCREGRPQAAAEIPKPAGRRRRLGEAAVNAAVMRAMARRKEPDA
jgi:hypothetical protein